ncbi:MAG: hypothetical protein IKT68_04860 [Clostridia bacterium]|nr:hypothetical protein [Clostridia bacterium]
MDEQRNMTQDELLEAAEQAFHQTYGAMEANEITKQVGTVTKKEETVPAPEEVSAQEQPAEAVAEEQPQSVDQADQQPTEEQPTEEQPKKALSTNGMAIGLAVGLVVGGAVGIISTVVAPCLIVGLLGGTLIGLVLDLKKDHAVETEAKEDTTAEFDNDNSEEDPDHTPEDPDQILNEENPYE